MKQLTKQDIKDVLKESGVVTEKHLKRELNKTKKELMTAIGNVAVNSPTFRQFKALEKRVSDLEPIVA